MLFKPDKIRVKFLQSAAAADWHYDVNDVEEFDADRARNFIAGRVAEPTDEPIGRSALPITCPACGAKHAAGVFVCTVCLRRIQ